MKLEPKVNAAGIAEQNFDQIERIADQIIPKFSEANDRFRELFKSGLPNLGPLREYSESLTLSIANFAESVNLTKRFLGSQPHELSGIDPNTINNGRWLLDDARVLGLAVFGFIVKVARVGAATQGSKSGNQTTSHTRTGAEKLAPSGTGSGNQTASDSQTTTVKSAPTGSGQSSTKDQTAQTGPGQKTASRIAGNGPDKCSGAKAKELAQLIYRTGVTVEMFEHWAARVKKVNVSPFHKEFTEVAKEFEERRALENSALEQPTQGKSGGAVTSPWDR
jgi:hypothetical protein